MRPKRPIGVTEFIEAGVTSNANDTLSDLALADACHANNPGNCSLEDFKTSYTEALN